MCWRDLELPRPSHQVRGEGVWPGADTQVSKQSNRGGHSRVWHTIRTQSGRQGTQPAPRFTHPARLKESFTQHQNRQLDSAKLLLLCR